MARKKKTTITKKVVKTADSVASMLDKAFTISERLIKITLITLDITSKITLGLLNIINNAIDNKGASISKAVTMAPVQAKAITIRYLTPNN